LAQTLSNEEQKKSTWQWYKNNPEVVEEVSYCIVTQISTTEAIERLKKIGFPMSSRTFGRMKKRILKNWSHRYDNMLTTDLIPYYLASNEALKLIDYELWKIVRNTKDDWKKMRALEMIRKSREDRFDLMQLPAAVDKMTKEVDKEWGIVHPKT